MGANLPGDEEAIKEINTTLSARAKEWLHHHLGNALNGVLGGIEIKNYDLARESAEHMATDLNRIYNE